MQGVVKSYDPGTGDGVVIRESDLAEFDLADHGPHTLDVRVPTTVSPPMGVAQGLAEPGLLTADFTDGRHHNTSIGGTGRSGTGLDNDTRLGRPVGGLQLVASDIAGPPGSWVTMIPTHRA